MCITFHAKSNYVICYIKILTNSDGMVAVGTRIVILPGFPHLLETPSGQMSKDGRYVDVFLDGGANQLAAERSG